MPQIFVPVGELGTPGIAAQVKFMAVDIHGQIALLPTNEGVIESHVPGNYTIDGGIELPIPWAGRILCSGDNGLTWADEQAIQRDMPRTVLLAALGEDIPEVPVVPSEMTTEFDPAGNAYSNDLGTTPITDGGAVALVEDVLGFLYQNQTTSGARPTYDADGLNGEPALLHDGGDCLFSDAAAAMFSRDEDWTRHYELYIPPVTPGSNGLAGVITDATNASPIVLTLQEEHALQTGDRVAVSAVLGNTAANGAWVVTVLSSTTVSLDTSVGNGAYTSGGVINRGLMVLQSDGKLGASTTFSLIQISGAALAKFEYQRRTPTVGPLTATGPFVRGSRHLYSISWHAATETVSFWVDSLFYASFTLADTGGMIFDRTTIGGQRTGTSTVTNQLPNGSLSGRVWYRNAVSTDAEVQAWGLANRERYDLPVFQKHTKIGATDKHNAFTSVERWNGKLWLTHREAEDHFNPPGVVRLWVSDDDGDTWTLAKTMGDAVAQPTLDKRDPHLVATPSRLFWYFLEVDAAQSPTRGTYVTYTDDGVTWSTPVLVGLRGWWGWSPTYTDVDEFLAIFYNLESPLDVQDASNTTPIVVTTTSAHDLETGMQVAVADVVGNTAANGTWAVTVLTPTTLSLDTSVGNGAYVSGGTVTPSRQALYSSVDGLDWTLLIGGFNATQAATEAKVIKLADDTYLSMSRVDSSTTYILGTAAVAAGPWSFSTKNYQFQCPMVLRLSDGRVLCSGRIIGQQCPLDILDPATGLINRFAQVGTVTESAYPGLCEVPAPAGEDGIWVAVSWYTRNLEGGTYRDIHFALVRVPDNA